MSEIMANECFCCKQSKTTYETRYCEGLVDDLLTAAQEGCLRCDLQAKCFACFGSDVFTQGNWFFVGEGFRDTVIMSPRGPDGSIGVDIFSLHGKRDSTPFNVIPVRRLLAGKTSSDTTFETIANWIRECDFEHPNCSVSKSASQMSSPSPKRLLEITGDQIVLREHVPNRPVYACLSHCWGDSKTTTRTTMETLDIFKLAVPWNDLSKTFQNAVDICRRLNIQYLWIDSLCIIQDSKVDWDEQAPLMANIYENAYLTIAAKASKSSTGGCYRTTDPVYLAKHVPDTEIYVRNRLPEFEVGRSAVDHEEWPLFYRAWIYQELKLSRRVLHFCAHEVIWVCKEVRKSESGFNDATLNQSTDWDNNETTTAVWSEKPPTCDLRMLWYRAVEEYSTLWLTFIKDKMPALAALTQRMEKLRDGDDHFLAGLWEKTLLFDLLWWVKHPPETGRLNMPRAPTWSWVSVPFAVSWGMIEGSIINSVSVVDARCTVKGLACMGDILEASITLRVPTLQASTGDDGSIILDSEQLYVSSSKYDYSFSLPGQSHIAPGTEVLIIAIGIFEFQALGLLLCKQKDGPNYERIGYVSLRFVDFRLDPISYDKDADLQHLDAERHLVLVNIPHLDITII